MDNLITLTAKYLIIVPLLVTAYIVGKTGTNRGHRRRDYLTLLIAGGLLSLLLAKIGSHFYYHPRPFISDGVTPLFTAGRDNGFPSDHTLLSAFLGFAALSYDKRIGAALLVVAALVGWARVAAGVHHFTDIIGSFIFTALAYWAVNWYIKSRAK